MRVPMLLLSVFVFSGFILSGCQPSRPPEETTVGPDGKPIASALYNNNCAACHGYRGEGNPNYLQGRSTAFRNHLWQKSITDEQIIRIIQGGKGMMPAFDSSFNPDELNALVGYIRSFDEAPAEAKKAPPKEKAKSDK